MDTINCYKIVSIGDKLKEGDEVVMFTKTELELMINDHLGRGEELRSLLSFLSGASQAVVVEKKDVANLVKDYA